MPKQQDQRQLSCSQPRCHRSNRHPAQSSVCGWVGVSKSMPDHASVSPLITERVIPKAPVSTFLELLVPLVLLLVVVPIADYIQ